MKFSCLKENLSPALTLVSGVTSKNINLPILNNILIKADNQKLEIITTNLEIAITINVRAKVEEPGSFTVPARTLSDCINLLNNERIDFELTGQELVVRCGKSSTKIKGTVAEDYPIIPTVSEGKGFVVDANKLNQGLARVLPAVAKNEIRPELAGVFFGFNTGGAKTLTLAATDSYRLAEDVVDLTNGAEEIKIVVPARAAQELVKALAVEGENKNEGAQILVSDNQLVVSYNNLQVISRLVTGQYPDYAQIIPSQFNTTVNISTTQLQKEVKAAGLFTLSGVNAVSLVVNPTTKTVLISSNSAQTGEYKSELEANINGAEVTVLLNHRYILDGLNNISTEETKLQMVNSESPCLLTAASNEKFRYIIMPIRQ